MRRTSIPNNKVTYGVQGRGIVRMYYSRDIVVEWSSDVKASPALLQHQKEFEKVDLLGGAYSTNDMQDRYHSPK